MSDPMSRRPVAGLPGASLGLMPLIAGTARAEGSVGIVETRKFTTTELQAAERRRAAGDDDRLRDLRQAGAGRPQRRAADARLHLEPSHGRPHHRQRRRGLVGRAGRPGQGDRHRPALRRVVQHAGLVLRLDHARRSKNPATGKPYGPDFPDISWSTSSARRRRCSTASASSTWSRSPARRSAATRPSSGASPTPTSWTGWCRWSPRPRARAARRR